MLSDAERTDARRHMGYSPSGDALQGHQASGTVEWRLLNLGAAEEAVLRRYLATLGALEVAIPGAGAGLDTGSAAGWVRNRDEVGERTRLFDDWRRRLCGFLGLPPGPGLAGTRNVVGLVV